MVSFKQFPKGNVIGTGQYRFQHYGYQRVLPSIYQQISYIEATTSNGAYIDLGIAYDRGCIIELGYIYGGGGNLQIFGATENSGRQRCLLTADYSRIASGGEGTFYYGDKSNQFNGISYLPNQISGQEEKIKFELRENFCESTNLITGQKSQQILDRPTSELSVPDSYTMTRTLYLLGQNYNTGYRGNGRKRVTYFKYFDKDTKPLRDMVPCYRKSDNVIGMYDFVSKTFFTNAGTGTFTKGPDI